MFVFQSDKKQEKKKPKKKSVSYHFSSLVIRWMFLNIARISSCSLTVYRAYKFNRIMCLMVENNR